MPKVSGIEIAKEITKNTKNKNIVIISSLDSENILIDSIASGAEGFLVKPIESSELISSVEKIYERSGKESHLA